MELSYKSVSNLPTPFARDTIALRGFRTWCTTTLKRAFAAAPMNDLSKFAKEGNAKGDFDAPILRTFSDGENPRCCTMLADRHVVVREVEASCFERLVSERGA